MVIFFLWWCIERVFPFSFPLPFILLRWIWFMCIIFIKVYEFCIWTYNIFIIFQSSFQSFVSFPLNFFPHFAFTNLHWVCGHLEKKLSNGYKEFKFIENSTCNIGFWSLCTLLGMLGEECCAFHQSDTIWWLFDNA